MTFGVPGSSVAVAGVYVIDFRTPSDTRLAAGLARFAQVEKDARGAVDAMARRLGRSDQAE